MGPICEYCNECKNQWLLGDPYASIAMNVKTNDYYGTHMRVLHIWKWFYGIYNRNDVGIICLKCVYLKKNL
jgi:hypothetical protein